MKILLDECVPGPMQKIIKGHECTTVQQHRWRGIKNGDLLRLAEKEFQLFITADQNIRYQENLTGRGISILELSTNDMRRILAAAMLILTSVDSLKPGKYRHLEIP